MTESYTVRAIKSGDDWNLEVLGVPFGGPYAGKDADGEYFDANTQLWLDQIGKRPIVHYHGYTDQNSIAAEPEIIGQEIGYEVKPDGVWFQVALDKTKEIAGQMWQAAQDGFARASSGAIQHLVRRDANGHIAIWPMAELSLMDISKGNYPANPYAVAMPALQKRFKAANLTLTITESGEGAETPGTELPPPSPVTNQINEGTTMENEPITLEQIAAFLDKREADKAEAERIRQLEAAAEELKTLKAQITGAEQIKRMPNPVADDKPAAQVVGYSKYDGFTLGQLGIAYDTLKAAGQIPSAELYRVLHAKAVKAVDGGSLFADHVARDKEGNIKREFAPEVTAQAIKAVKAINPMQMADTPAAKANELMYSTQASYGDEWVPALWSPELWDLVRNGAPVLSRFRQVEVPGESLTVPSLAGRTTVYKVGQSTDQADLNLGTTVNATMTKATTGNVTLTPVKGMAWLAWSGEFAEDSIVAVLPSLQSALQQDLMEQIDEILISGDTDTTTGNISDNGDGSISTSWHLLIANGLRDHALANATTVDIGAMDATKPLAVMGKLGTNGAFAIDPMKLFWIFDPGSYRTTLALGETLTAEKTGSISTFQSGRLMQLYGSDLVVSDRFAKTDSSGYINNTGGSNTKGAFLLVRPDRWLVGFGRRITIEVPSRGLVEIASDTQHLVASFRLAFMPQGTTAAAYGYDMTIVG